MCDEFCNLDRNEKNSKGVSLDKAGFNEKSFSFTIVPRLELGCPHPNTRIDSLEHQTIKQLTPDLLKPMEPIFSMLTPQINFGVNMFQNLQNKTQMIYKTTETCLPKAPESFSFASSNSGKKLGLEFKF